MIETRRGRWRHRPWCAVAVAGAESATLRLRSAWPEAVYERHGAPARWPLGRRQT